ncbi:MAG: nucleotidyltransferase family protein [Anaerolineae bacterium]
MSDQPSGFDQLVRLLEGLWAPRRMQWPAQPRWPELFEAAQHHGVQQLLWSVLQERTGAAPEWVRDRAKQSHYQVAAVNALRIRELGHILSSLSTVGNPPLLLKGAALAETLYGNQFPRPVGDFDLTIRPEDAQVYRAAICQLGYVPRIAEIGPGPDLVYHNQQGFDWPDRTRAPIEIHWHLLDTLYYMRQIPMDWFWAQTDTMHLAGHPVRVLRPEANLLYLPAHLAFHHRYHGLRWYVDLALLIHEYGDTLDWDAVVAQARAFELLLVIRETLDRLAAYWPSLTLDEPRRKLHDPAPTAFEGKLFRLLASEPRSLAKIVYANLISLPNLTAVLGYLWRIAFPQRSYMAQSYGLEHVWQLPFWYLYRLGQGMVKFVRSATRSLAGS